jgi:hypothetical protein
MWKPWKIFNDILYHKHFVCSYLKNCSHLSLTLKLISTGLVSVIGDLDICDENIFQTCKSLRKGKHPDLNTSAKKTYNCPEKPDLIGHIKRTEKDHRVCNKMYKKSKV